MASGDSSPEFGRPSGLARSPSYIHFTPRRAMASFENLVVLANYEERLRGARKVVWRDKGEKPVEVQDLWECLEHASRGGLRAGTLAFLIRSGVNIILLMSRIRKVPRKFRLSLIRHALLGEDSTRFGAMLGIFVALYKFILNALPILLPEPKRRRRSDVSDTPFEEDSEVEVAIPTYRQAARRARLSVSAQAHHVWVRKRTRRWYAVFAGAVAGAIAITFEKRNRRLGIAQQMFVRGLQGSYNAFSTKRGIRIPHGDVILFTLCCGQIMYGFLMRPDTLPPSYTRWIQAASKVPTAGVSMNRDLVRDGVFKISDMESVMARRDITPGNYARLAEQLKNALQPPATRSYGPPFGPCAAIHPELDSCPATLWSHFWLVFRWMVPIYGSLHFIPMMLFRRDRLVKEPTRMLLRTAWGTARSSAFLGVFVLIFQAFFCGKNNMYLKIAALRNSNRNTLLPFLARLIPAKVITAVLASKGSHFVGGLLSGLSLFVEEKRRREELAMYVLPKGLESAWVMARGKGWVFGLGSLGDVVLTAVGMGMVMSTYQNDPQHLSGLVRRIMYQFIGPN